MNNERDDVTQDVIEKILGNKKRKVKYHPEPKEEDWFPEDQMRF